jgi:hypothetical protein
LALEASHCPQNFLAFGRGLFVRQAESIGFQAQDGVSRGAKIIPRYDQLGNRQNRHYRDLNMAHSTNCGCLSHVGFEVLHTLSETQARQHLFHSANYYVLDALFGGLASLEEGWSDGGDP